MIKNLIFDIGNVLAGFDWKEYLHSFGFDAATEKTLAKAMFTSPQWNEVDRGILSKAEVCDLLVANAPEYKEQITRVFMSSENCISHREYSIEWLKSLKAKGFNLYYLSNYGEYFYHATRERALDFLPYMDGGIFSYEVKLIKPDPAIFQTLIRKYPNILPEESIFFDDSAANVEAAANLDFNAIIFKNKEQAERAMSHLLAVI